MWEMRARAIAMEDLNSRDVWNGERQDLVADSIGE